MWGWPRGGRAQVVNATPQNYLGHSINAPTGRWQKNKDVHWYNRGIEDSEQEKQDEIRRVKQAEEDAMATALWALPSLHPNILAHILLFYRGFKPTPRTTGEVSSAGNPNAIPVQSKEDRAEALAAKEEKRRLKEERRAAKEERRALRGKIHTEHHSSRHRHRDNRPTHDRTPERPRRYSRSPESVRARPRYSRSPSLTRRDYHENSRRSRSPRRSRLPQHRRRSYSPRRADYDDDRTLSRRQ